MALHRHPRSLRLRRRFAERIRVDEKRGGDLGQGRALDRGVSLVAVDVVVAPEALVVVAVVVEAELATVVVDVPLDGVPEVPPFEVDVVAGGM